MANLRPLQPAPMDQEQPVQKPSKPVLTQKPKRTVTLGACVACRRRKSKCDGSRPTCTCCAQKDTECIYELGPHEKPSQAMKRKNEEMQGELSSLRQLYDFLRLKPEHEAFEILRQIRETPGDTPVSQRIKELADSVRQEDRDESSSRQPPVTQPPDDALALPPIGMALHSLGPDTEAYLKNLPFPHSILNMDPQGRASQRRKYASDADVSTHPPLQSPDLPALKDTVAPVATSKTSDPRFRCAVNWTRVTDDAGLVEDLMSRWYRQEYKFYHFMDFELFLEDMVHGRRVYCSELLVNAILASGGFHSPLVKDRAKPFADNIITAFFTEARQLWDEEKGSQNLPKVHANMIMYMVLGKIGRDKVGHFYLAEACDLGQYFGMHGPEGGVSLAYTRKPNGIPSDQWLAAVGVTAWSLFNFQLLMSSTYSFPPLIAAPPDFPTYHPYHGGNDPFEALFQSECWRQTIMLDVSQAFSKWTSPDSQFSPDPDTADTLCLRLQKWWDERSPSLDPHKNPLPENLLTAMVYHCSKIAVVQPFLFRNDLPEPSLSYRRRAQSILSISLKELRRLLTLHEIHYSWDDAIPFILHSIMVASFGSLDQISTLNPRPTHLALETSEPYLGLLTCLRALSSISGFIYYAQPLLRLLTQACQAMDVRLPGEVMETLGNFMSEEWTRMASSMVSSQYVADMRNAASDLEKRRMDMIVAQWEALTIEDEGGAQEAG